MKDPHFFKYDHWYYPIGSISFRIHEEGTVYMFYLCEDEAVGIFEGKEAEVMKKMLLAESLDLDGIGEVESNG